MKKFFTKSLLLGGMIGCMAIVSGFGLVTQHTQAAGLAVPTLVTYAVNYSAGSHGNISGTVSQVVAKGFNAATVTAVPDSGYSFTQWSDGVTTASRTDTNVQGTINVSASFVLNPITVPTQFGNLNTNSVVSYTLTYTAGSHGSIQGVTSQSVLLGGTAATVKAIPNSGYKFSYWSDGVTTASRTETNVSANKNVTAYFVPVVVIDSGLPTFYTMTYTAGSHGSIQGTTVQSVLDGGSASTVKAIPDSGYKFKYWSDGVTTASRTDTDVTEDTALVATFGPLSSGGSSGGGSSQTVGEILGSGICPIELMVTQNLKSGAHDGEYLKYNGGTVTQVYILQKQINRILAASYNQAAGPVDGRFGPLTKLGVQRLQLALVDSINANLGPKGADGIVGAFTRAAMNNSCGGM